MHLGCLFLLGSLAASSQVFQLPTVNQALFEPGGEERFFVGTVGKNWTSGGFGCVRTDGGQMHEGLDIRCLLRDKRGEPADAVLATAHGTVAYINTRSALSNYGKYIILRHQVEGLEIYSLYAHLSDIRAGLKAGQTVYAGEPIGVMGRTANTAQSITRDRAHLHFELGLLLNDRFGAWYRKNHGGERNDHGDWNGQNLIGIDPQAVLLGAHEQKDQFSLLKLIRQQAELCRVLVRARNFSWVKRYQLLVSANAAAEKEGIAGYELVLNFNGLPFELIPRAPSEIKSKTKIQLLSVNAAEHQKNPCGHLVIRKSGHWELTPHARDRLELLTF